MARSALALLCLSLGFLGGLACRPAAEASPDPSADAPPGSAGKDAPDRAPAEDAPPLAARAAAPAPDAAGGDALEAFAASIGPVVIARVRGGDARAVHPDAWCPLDAATSRLSDRERFLARDVLTYIGDDLTAKQKLDHLPDRGIPRHPACGG
jgi:hypothetical protein